MKKIVVLLGLIISLLCLSITAVAAEAPLISIGDYNENVIKLHQKLSELGYYGLRPESPWGPDSEWALKVLQWNMDWEQTGVISSSDEIETILSLDHVIGKNLLVDSDYYIEKDNNSEEVGTKIFAIRSEIDLQAMIGKPLTISVLVNTPGERGTSMEDVSNYMANRFGVHGIVKWADSTGANEEKNVYPATELLSQTVDNVRISSTFTVAAPEGYDTIKSISVAMQDGARPAEDNTAVWSIGYPKMEYGLVSTEWVE